jgi:F420-dependent oxidoreductase-like protein
MKITLGAFPAVGGLAALVESAQAAADAGFSRVWFPQMPPASDLPSWDPLTTIALAGIRTPGIEFGTSVMVAQTQHPFVLARQALTASAGIGGRVTLGLGVSHQAVVTDMFGLSYASPAAYLREYLEVLLPALAGKPVDHHGARITAVGQLELGGAPVPPVIISALGPRMLQLAGELAEGTVTAWTGLKTVAEHIVPRINAAASDAGRPTPQVVVGVPVSVTADADAARQQIVASMSPGDFPAYRAVLDLEGVDSVADVCVFGDETEVAAQLRRFADAGATEFSAFPIGDPATVTRTLGVLAGLSA